MRGWVDTGRKINLMKWIFAIEPEPAVCLAPDSVENLLASLSLKECSSHVSCVGHTNAYSLMGRDFPEFVDLASVYV